MNCRILPGHSAEEVRQELVKVFADPKITVRYSDTLRKHCRQRSGPEELAASAAAP